MAEEQGIRRVALGPSDLHWRLPAAARRKMDVLAKLADTDRLGSGRPLPAKRRLEILGRLLDHLLPDGTEERLPETAASLGARDRDYLANLIHGARAALDKAQEQAPSTLLGFPPDTRATWANLLSPGWIPWQKDWIGVRRD